MEIKIAESKEDFLKCWEAVRELRPHLSLDEYLVLILKMMDEGYKMIYTEENEVVVSFCGYRYQTMLYRNKSIYIDDLCTLPEARGKGYAAALINYVFDEAKETHCKSVHLDSGHHRFDAHRFYLNQKFKITSHHFSIDL